MQKAWTPPVRWVFVVATLLGLFSTAQAYRLTSLNPKRTSTDRGRLAAGPESRALVHPGGADRPIFRIAARFRLDAERWIRAIAIHARGRGDVLGRARRRDDGGAGDPVAGAAADAGGPMADVHPATSTSRNLDWTLMTYAAVVGLSYALGYYRESQARALKAAQLETS